MVDDCTKDKLRILNKKEMHFKDKVFEAMLKSRVSDKEAIRVFAFLLNHIKGEKHGT